MYIIAIAWIYVVSMMAFTEPSVMAGIMTFLIYGAIPLGVFWFIANKLKRQIIKPKDRQNSAKKTGELQ